jgi:hypothetical protein
LEFARNRKLVQNKRGQLVCSDYELSAVDLRGRLKWTKALCDELEECFDIDGDPIEGGRSFFWFCCADVECAARRYSSLYYAPLKAINHYRRGFRGLNYIAMLEPVIYASFSQNRPPALRHLNHFEQIVSWHTHGLAWGDNRKELRERFNKIEEDELYVPLLPNLKGCWAKFINPEYLGQKVAYMCKTPRVVNRVYCKNPEQFDRDCWTFQQKEAEAQPGQHIHYFKLLAPYTLDQLAFGGGEGSEILQRVKKPFVQRVHS